VAQKIGVESSKQMLLAEGGELGPGEGGMLCEYGVRKGESTTLQLLVIQGADDATAAGGGGVDEPMDKFMLSRIEYSEKYSDGTYEYR
jgi:hypothetical protein